MLVIGLLVFAAIFAVAVLAIMAIARPKASEKAQAALATALKQHGAAGEEDIELRVEYRFSTIPWLNRLLSQRHAALSLGRILNQAGVAWTPGKFVLFSALLCVAGNYFINMAVRDFRLSAPLGLVAGSLPLVFVGMKRSRRFARMQEKLPETLDLIVSALRAGNSLTGALGVASTEAPPALRREFRRCYEEQNFGIDMRSALGHMLDRVPLQDLRLMATAMLIHKESGGNLSEVLEKTASVVRERSRLHQQVRVHTAQGRFSGVVLALLPVALGATLELLNPAYFNVLFGRPLGHKLVAAAIAMNVIGIFVIRRIVQIRI